MNKKRISRFAIFLVIIVITVLAGFATVYEVNAQDRSANDLYERLKKQGVPVLQVITTRRLPYEMEIHLQSTSAEKNINLDDGWFMIISHREATLAHRIGIRLSRYRLNVYNTKGEIVYSTDTYLYPEDRSQKAVGGTAVVDGEMAQNIVAGEIRLADLNLDVLNVVQEGQPDRNGQVLQIQVSGKDIETVNRSLPTFLDSMFQMLDTINQRHATNIVLCHMRVVDGTGTVLLDYARDLEGGNSQWTLADGVYNEWFPKPEPASISITPTAAAYPPPSTPAPSTPVPYP